MSSAWRAKARMSAHGGMCPPPSHSDMGIMTPTFMRPEVRSMAGGAALVGEAAVGGLEDPLIVARVQGELEDAVIGVVSNQRVRLDVLELFQCRSSGADDELADAADHGLPVDVHRREPLVVVVMPDQHDLRVRLGQGGPEGLHRRVVAVVAR